MSHYAQGVFRVVGHLIDGWLTVEYVTRLDENPKPVPPPGMKIISMWDDLWVDRIPIHLVEIDDRLPNTLLKVTVRDRDNVVQVERYNKA